MAARPGRSSSNACASGPSDRDSKTVILFSHPIGGGSFLPLVTALAHAGHHVIYCNTRYRGNDTALILEKCVLDLGACIADLKTRFGYEKVILGGWSGGGSLSLFYQDQAEHPTITAHAGGRPRRPRRREAASRRRHHAACRPHQPLGHADRMDGPVDPRRGPPVRPRRRPQHLRSRLPCAAALHRRVRRPLPRRADRPQPPHHGARQERRSPT